MDTINVSLIIIVIFLILWKLCAKPYGFPPGPFRWPIVGNLINIKSRMMHHFGKDLACEYGELVGIYLGQRPIVFVTGLDAIKEAGNREDLSGRPISETITDGNKGIFFNFGHPWREQRRFTLRHLRDLGFGKQTMQGIIHEEVNTLLQEVAKMAGTDWSTPVAVQNILGTSGINVLWHVMSGQRYAHADEKLQALIGLVKKMLNSFSAAGGIQTFFPTAARIYPSLNTFKPLRDEILVFIMEEVKRHKETHDHDNPRDFIDIYLTEVDKQSTSIESSFTEKQLGQVCLDLFIAGVDTTFNSVTFALVYMVRFPEVQEKVQAEIDRIVGRDRLPALSDKANLIYTEATLWESLRMSSVVPLAIAHAPLYAKNGVRFRGHILPKNCRVLLNIAQLHSDPKIWGDPENFRPERFISSENKLIHYEALMPFGTGKRQCLGESLARNNLFLFFTAIMQRYSLSVPLGEDAPSLEATGAITLSPQPFATVVTPRFVAA